MAKATQPTAAFDSGVDAARRASMLSIFTSASTLVCCALPALFVALGAGAALVSVTTRVPELVWLSENKPLVFGVAGVMLALAGVLQWRARALPCPADPELASACARARAQSERIYKFSVAVFAVGAFFAFCLG